MGAITRIEDIFAWKEARELTRLVYRQSRQGVIGKDYGLRDQICRASVSIMANIAEGFDSGSNREFIRFLGYAMRSATEVQSHLYVALDQEYLDVQHFDLAFKKTVEVKNLIAGFIRYLRNHQQPPATPRNLEP